MELNRKKKRLNNIIEEYNNCFLYNKKIAGHNNYVVKII